MIMTKSDEARISFPEKTRLAVIDLDGTLLKGMTAERVFFLHLFVHGRIGVLRTAGFMLTFVGDVLRMGFRRAIATNARFLRGETPEQVRLWVDDMYRVPDRDAFLAARELARTEAILAGGSSGAALWGVRPEGEGV